ncbi:hypothetical protein INR49_027939 [Caranx melampygus]|nr:hypothetical protein INR49_027939 [Caranx melampygus]
MAVLVKYTESLLLFVVVSSLCGASFAEKSRDNVGLEIRCGEVDVKITATRQFFEERRVPFTPEHLRLGAKSTRARSCEPNAQMSDRETMVISAGLRECGTESSVHGEWLVYSNQLFLVPAVVPISSGSVIVRGATTVIPVECHDCTFQRRSSVYQQGEPVFLEASVEAPLHPPLTVYVDYCVATLKPDTHSLPSYRFITKNGCHVDSVLPGSSSRFLYRQQNNRLCFSFQAFHFNQESEEKMFISCHLRAALKQNSHRYKACFFHRPTFSWRATEGDNALCDCCGSDDCLQEHGKKSSGHTGRTTLPDQEKTHEADTAVGPLHTLSRTHWTGRLSINHSRAFQAHS